nr:transposon Ty3-I Gag-Pol polyprotein [Tanacetum cinerariifolium]
MDNAKVAAVANWQIPTSVSLLHAFLGLTGYYRRFIRQYASIAHPLTTLLQKNNFQWSQEAQSAFETLKQALLTALLRHISDQTIQTPEQQDLMPKLIGYNFRIEYKAGTSNGGADGLSRCFNFALSTSQATIVGDIQAALATSSSISSIINQVEKDPVAMSSYQVKNGLLYRKNRMVIPPESRDLINKLLVEFNSSTLGGHAGFLRTYARIATYFFWPAMRRIFVIIFVLVKFANVLKHHNFTPLDCFPSSDSQSSVGGCGNGFHHRSSKFSLVYSTKRDALLAQLKINLGRAQARMKKYVDKKRCELSFAIGDYVFVKLQPYRQHSVKLQQNQKLGMHYFGPFQVLQQIGPVAYKLDLSATSRIHPVFHVSFLKPCVGEPSAQYIPLPLLSTPEGPLVYITQILDSRKVKVKDGWDIEVLV